MATEKKTKYYVALIVVAVAFVLGSWANYIISGHDYDECASAAEIATLDDFEFNSTIDPEYKPKKSDKSRNQIADNVSCSDLRAQWTMSNIAMMGYIAGLFGLVFLGITVFETKSAADLTRQALKETKVNARRELRAYLHVVPHALNINSTDLVPTIAFRFFNNGQTPAINIKCIINFVVEQHSQETIDSAFHCKVSIPPNGKQDVLWPLEELDAPWCIPVEIRAEYNDIFGQERFVKIGFSVSHDDIPNTRSTFLDGVFSEQQQTMINPDHIVEMELQYIAYEDDLQKEAEEYAEANKTS